MRTRTAWAAFALGLLLMGQAAHAQRVVVLELSGDKRGRLRAQIENALKRAKVVQVVSLKEYKAAATKRKVRGAAAMRPSGVAKVSRTLRLDAAVDGAVGSSFFVRILGPDGKEIWSKDLPVKRGLISADHARKLAKAIAAAAAQGAQTPPSSDGEESEEEVPEQPTPTPTPVPPVAEAPVPPPEVKPDAPTSLPTVDPGEQTQKLSDAERERRRREEMAEAHTEIAPPPVETMRDEDLEAETKKRVVVGPKYATVLVTAASTFRSYCSRPGVSSCAEFDRIADPSTRPQGEYLSFTPSAPYWGFQVAGELFPLAGMRTSFLRGLGVVGNYSRGFSHTVVKVETISGETPQRDVISIDEGYQVMATYRYYFSFGSTPLIGFAGLRGGLLSRNFDVDPSAGAPLLGSHRSFPAIGLDAAIPLASFIRFDLSALYFVNPRPGPDEIVAYGDPNTEGNKGATGQGLGIEGGFTLPDLWGPLGVTTKVRWNRYQDRYFGAGQKWKVCNDTQCGGVAEESYTSIHGGVTASF